MTVFDSLLNNTFIVARERRISDGRGGWPISYQAVGSVLGRIRPATSVEQEVALSAERQISHVLYIVAGENVIRGDRVVCGALEVEIQGVREPSLAGHHLEIDCLARQYGEPIQEAAREYWPGLYWPPVLPYWPAGYWPGTAS